jgi:N-acetylglucosamine-6-phosphate deacetylase
VAAEHHLGWVDLQVNGYRGVDFSSADLTPDQAADACRQLLRDGPAAFLPTLITCPDAVYRRNLPMLAKLVTDAEFRGMLLGIHLEGPFISREPGYVGAHDAASVRDPDPDYLSQLQDLAEGCIRLLTVAAETVGAPALVRHARSLGMAVSVGHSHATAEDLARCADAGAVAVTHLGNGIPNTLPRHENPIWAALAEDRLSAMIITDGHHLPPEVIQVVLRAKGVRKTIVVSDQAPLAGMPPGEYRTLGNDVVLDETGRLYNPAGQHLVGSSRTMAQCMDHLASLGALTPEELRAVGHTNPMALIAEAGGR